MAENKSVRQNRLLLKDHTVLACRIPLASIHYYPQQSFLSYPLVKHMAVEGNLGMVAVEGVTELVVVEFVKWTECICSFTTGYDKNLCYW